MHTAFASHRQTGTARTIGRTHLRLRGSRDVGQIVSPVPVTIRAVRARSPGADVGSGRAQSRRRCGQWLSQVPVQMHSSGSVDSECRCGWG